MARKGRIYKQGHESILLQDNDDFVTLLIITEKTVDEGEVFTAVFSKAPLGNTPKMSQEVNGRFQLPNPLILIATVMPTDCPENKTQT